MNEKRDNPTLLGDRPAVLFAWRALRAAALLGALLTAYSLPLEQRWLSGIVGFGIGYVALTVLAGASPRTAVLTGRARVTIDLALIAILAGYHAPGLLSPLRYLLFLPILDMAMTQNGSELLGAGTAALVLTASLALRDPPAYGAENLLFGGAVAAVTVIFWLLVTDAFELRQRDRQLRQQRAVAEVASAMRRNLGFDDLGKLILDAALDLTGGQAGTLALLSDSGDVFEPVSTRSRGPRPPAHRIEPVLPLNGHAREVTIDPAADNGGAIVHVPLLGDEDRVIGRLTLLTLVPPEGLDGSDRAALSSLGAQAGLAWENAWLRHSLHEQASTLDRSSGELSALVEVGRALVGIDHHEVLDEILRKAITLMAAERGSLMLIDDDSGELRIETARGLPGEIVEETSIPLGEGFAGQVALTGRPMRLLDTLGPGTTRAEVRDALCVPLQLHDRVIGVLNLSNKSGPGVFTERDLDFLVAMANQAAVSIHNAQLLGEVQELFLSTVSTLAKAVDAKDRYTAGHSHRVTLYALEIANELSFPAEDRDMLRIAGLMHDVGKIGIAESILRKPGPLTAEERAEMQQHPLHGARIVAPIKQLHAVLPGVLWHHERCDGTGYPDGLSADEIPPQARVLMVADAWDAMTSDRPYRNSLDDEIALAELANGRGTQWHAEVIDAFRKAYDEGRISPLRGSMPELADGILGS